MVGDWRKSGGQSVLSFVSNLYVCIVEIKRLKIIFLCIGQWIFAAVIFIQFLKLFRYSGEKVAQVGYKKGEMPVNLT